MIKKSYEEIIERLQPLSVRNTFKSLQEMNYPKEKIQLNITNIHAYEEEYELNLTFDGENLLIKGVVDNHNKVKAYNNVNKITVYEKINFRINHKTITTISVEHEYWFNINGSDENSRYVDSKYAEGSRMCVVSIEKINEVL